MLYFYTYYTFAFNTITRYAQIFMLDAWRYALPAGCFRNTPAIFEKVR